MRISRCFPAAAGLCLLVFAQCTTAGTAEEIRHLLEFVERSGCEFIRNGKTYDSREARSHIERKYNYVKSRVSSAEDFVEYAATRSSMSGDSYTVDCGGLSLPSSDWLIAELAAFRESRRAPEPGASGPSSN